MLIDLARNTIDGHPHHARVCELALIVSHGPVRTGEAITRMYGVAEPGDAGNALKQIAYRARRAGIAINGVAGKRGGYYRLG